MCRRETIHALARSIPMSSRRLSARLLATPETPGKTRDTRDSRKRCTRSKRKNVKNFSSHRKESTSNSQDTTQTNPESSRSSSGTSNRQNEWCKSTLSSSSACRNDNRNPAPLRRRKKNTDEVDGTYRAPQLSGAPPGLVVFARPGNTRSLGTLSRHRKPYRRPRFTGCWMPSYFNPTMPDNPARPDSRPAQSSKLPTNWACDELRPPPSRP